MVSTFWLRGKRGMGKGKDKTFNLSPELVDVSISEESASWIASSS
ncbi:hypothetical protein FDUTEX481_04953 [Tolypothrix sp. PCC 7601]|nr:hypothetical protein FDUTEX481_04953 [Tolypothrix sp. PCC 7601]